ncbi:hypothetical protein MTR67_040832 [Solanum verrucosum]|uniref:Uncharacterized protein n=2 Tax=Solanum TaxID=4107 RepID=A0AAF0ZPR6_SOLVR|nr:SH3 domain-containing protein C23A1.17-like [Solanum verrucosum]XP_049350213.1 SH3 domain-containing protein C23A1.17-like [Solanum verrucosum]WMV47447.1 hypothetical protein MTR67_040832 [Solanum verrucosum]
MCAVFLTILLSIITTSPLAHAQLGLGGILGGLGGILGRPIVPPVGGQVPPIGVGQLPIPNFLGPLVGPITGPILGPIAGPILGPILGQPIRPPVGQVPPIVPPVGQVPPIVPPVGQVPPIVPPVGQVPPIVPPVGGQVVNITILGSLSCSVPGSNVPGPGVSGVNVTIICGNTTIAQASTNSQGIINVSVMTTTSVLSGNTCIARIPLPIANCTLTPNTGTLVAPVILIGNLIQDLVGLTFAAIFGILTSLATVTLS